MIPLIIHFFSECLLTQRGLEISCISLFSAKASIKNHGLREWFSSIWITFEGVRITCSIKCPIHIIDIRLLWDLSLPLVNRQIFWCERIILALAYVSLWIGLILGLILVLNIVLRLVTISTHLHDTALI